MHQLLQKIKRFDAEKLENTETDILYSHIFFWGFSSDSTHKFMIIWQKQNKTK